MLEGLFFSSPVRDVMPACAYHADDCWRKVAIVEVNDDTTTTITTGHIKQYHNTTTSALFFIIILRFGKISKLLFFLRYFPFIICLG